MRSPLYRPPNNGESTSWQKNAIRSVRSQAPRRQHQTGEFSAGCAFGSGERTSPGDATAVICVHIDRRQRASKRRSVPLHPSPGPPLGRRTFLARLRYTLATGSTRESEQAPAVSVRHHRPIADGRLDRPMDELRTPPPPRPACASLCSPPSVGGSAVRSHWAHAAADGNYDGSSASMVSALISASEIIAPSHTVVSRDTLPSASRVSAVMPRRTVLSKAGAACHS